MFETLEKQLERKFRNKWGRWDLNPRHPAPEAGSLNQADLRPRRSANNIQYYLFNRNFRFNRMIRTLFQSFCLVSYFFQLQNPLV
jgi:hypothetical protein